MARTKTINPVLDGMVDVPAAAPKAVAETVRVRVRLKAGGAERRYRAGLGPFGQAPVQIEASPGQRSALEADPWLEVEVLP
ncbi:MAG: hypothetical protein N2690_01765 [Rhodocyclaceae bacterium]|nr:hypothetical protein [Rhodocyclaceae bacterium]